MKDYSFENGKLIVKEMVDMLCLDMARKNLVTDSVTLQVGYSHACHRKPARGTTSLAVETNADTVMVPSVVGLYEKIVDPSFPIRRIHISCNHVILDEYYQQNLFDLDKDFDRNKRLQEAVLAIKDKYGRNAILKGRDLEKEATAKERNRQIGGHKSGE